MAKETFYFSHDFNARSDRKMINLLMACGIEGVGIYWCIVEMLYEEGGYLMRTECERIAFELRTDTDRINKVINSSLFCRDEEKFWSESILKRLDIRKEKSEKARESANYKWGNANGMRSHSDGNAIKERKEKENKEKNRGFEFSADKTEVVFPDGTSQKLGEGQLLDLQRDNLSARSIVKGSIY